MVEPANGHSQLMDLVHDEGTGTISASRLGMAGASVGGEPPNTSENTHKKKDVKKKRLPCRQKKFQKGKGSLEKGS